MTMAQADPVTTHAADDGTGDPDAERMSALAFRVAVLRHHHLVYRVANSLLGDAHEAEDVTQEVFLRYWQHGSGVRATREWLLRVARNACLDRLRRVRETVDADSAEHENLQDRHDPAWHSEQHQLATRLGALLAALPEPQRSLVVLFDVHGLDGASCARILGLNVNQVKVYLHRARRQLRGQLGEVSCQS
jgi:RNA polymerase sigma-70 factor (ECF subfamily)